MKHEYHYVHTAIGTHQKFMSWKNFMSVSAAIMSSSDDMESALYWYNKACDDGIVFW